MSTPTFFLGGAFLPSLTKALHAVQDADLYLQGCRRAEVGVRSAMESHREALLPLRRFLSTLKVL